MRVELLPYDLQFQMFKILSIETEDEQGIIILLTLVSILKFQSILYHNVVKS